MSPVVISSSLGQAALDLDEVNYMAAVRLRIL